MEEAGNYFEIEIRENGMQAWLKVFKSNAFSIGEAAEAIKKMGITFGIKGDTIRTLAGNGFPFGQYLIAEGKEPVNGEDSKCECLVALTPKPVVIERDNEESKYVPICITNVTEGQQLVKYFPPSKGENGSTIFGKELPAMPGKQLSNPKGLFTDFDPHNPNFLLATKSGNFEWDGLKARVEKEYIINGDVSIANGTFIEFVGDLKVTGDVRVGITLKVGGNLSIFGAVEDVVIDCGGNIQVKGGIFGSGTGKMFAKINIDLNHAYNFIIKCNNEINIRKDVIACTLFAKSIIAPHGCIMGGSVTVHNFIEIKEVGKEEYNRTTVTIGGKNQLAELVQNLETEILALEGRIKGDKDLIFRLAKEKLTNQAAFPEEKEARLNKKRSEIDGFNKTLLEMKERRDKLLVEIKQLVPKLIVYGKVYPNVHLTINDVSMITQESHSNLTFYEKDNVIVKFKNSR